MINIDELDDHGVELIREFLIVHGRNTRAMGDVAQVSYAEAEELVEMINEGFPNYRLGDRQGWER